MILKSMCTTNTTTRGLVVPGFDLLRMVLLVYLVVVVVGEYCFSQLLRLFE